MIGILSRRTNLEQPNMIFKYIVCVALIGSVSSSAELLTAKPTYQRRDAITGQMVTCEKCPPGMFVEKHCTSSHPTICKPCPDLHYIQYWNYLQKCHYCNVFCVEHQYEKQQCNSTHNRVCECKAGYYLESEFCLKHSECPAGAGVIKAGTAFQDTSCAPCSAGFFSPTSSSSEHRIAHTNCSAQGLVVNVPGNRYHNTLCTACKKYVGTSVSKSVCDDALIQSVAHQKIPVKKITKFLNLLLIQGALRIRNHILTEDKNMMHATLYPLLVRWKETVKVENVSEIIVSILETAKIRNVLQNIQDRFW